MSLLKIARMGHPVLGGRAKEVPDPTAPEIKRLVRDMIETMHDANGVGLAAPQIYVPLRLFVFFAPDERADTGASAEEATLHTAPLTVLINPEVEFILSPSPVCAARCTVPRTCAIVATTRTAS